MIRKYKKDFVVPEQFSNDILNYLNEKVEFHEQKRKEKLKKLIIVTFYFFTILIQSLVKEKNY